MALTLVSAVLYPAVEANLRDQMDDSLVVAAQQAPAVAAAVKDKYNEVNTPPVEFPTVPIGIGSIQMQIVPQPVQAGPSAEFVDITGRDVAVADGTAGPYFRDATYSGVAYRVYTDALPGSHGALVRTAVPADEPVPTLRRLAGLLAGSTVAAVLLAFLVSRLAARRVLRPVRRLTETVELIRTTGDLSIPVPADGRDEIGRLGTAFAAMTTALDESVGTQRRLVADASHELRTPLTSLTVNLELLAENLADPQAPHLAAAALAQAGELRTLINDLVDLARYGQAAFHTEDVRLDLVAERVAARAATRAPHIEVHVSGEPTLVHGDPDALERAVANLVDNAVKWSPPGGRVEITVAGGVLDVADTGPGIPAEDLAFVFDRFYRSPAARAHPGSGLGLAIVRQVAEAHGGTAEAIPSRQGAVLRLTLPDLG
ncbi:two-component system sensor histidine kinase MprB [Allocatelliglobosispora scoriae]|uniref:histidine kinase n=1 Tax=Allocatelliglobosispora scoriae TaxID=643052 RepID=A0A841BHU9_9ACTN|nr:HAMP domain-containing sensor histidine kinase [Allocatelliglobosispora scoriae]MBB5866759.1 two-component system sensor histidine kinase MprB [Allocatelliglobosispora scoriae]